MACQPAKADGAAQFPTVCGPADPQCHPFSCHPLNSTHGLRYLPFPYACRADDGGDFYAANYLDCMGWGLRSRVHTAMSAASLALGRFHERGEGVEKDAAEALRWYAQASESSHLHPELFDNARFADQAVAARERMRVVNP